MTRQLPPQLTRQLPRAVDPAATPAVTPADEQGAAAQEDITQLADTISTLQSLYKLQSELKRDLQALGQKLEAAQTESEKNEIQAQLNKLEVDLQTTTTNLRGIAAGADIASLRPTEEVKFSLQEELFSLLKPALKEMRDMTSHVRVKSELKDKIAYYREKQPVAELAVTNIAGLLASNEDKSLERYLEDMLAEWRKQLTVIRSELQSAELQLEKIESSESSLAEASQSYLKSFFQQRGLYLGQALLSVIVILLLSRLSYRAMVKVIPGYRQEHRSFRIRLLDLVHRMITIVLAIMGPMVVFYLVEDWVLFSLGILLLLGIGLTLRHALPRYWQVVQLFLNIGSVREGERIDLDGLAWRVRQINFFSMLENPTADLSQRVRIDDLVDLKSRPMKQGDPWFPCKKDDWVLLADGFRGKVTGISQELVELIERGGARRTYTTPGLPGAVTAQPVAQFPPQGNHRHQLWPAARQRGCYPGQAEGPHPATRRRRRLRRSPAQPARRVREGQHLLAGYCRHCRLRRRSGRPLQPPAPRPATLVRRGLQRKRLGDPVHPADPAPGRRHRLGASPINCRSAFACMEGRSGRPALPATIGRMPECREAHGCARTTTRTSLYIVGTSRSAWTRVSDAGANCTGVG